MYFERNKVCDWLRELSWQPIRRGWIIEQRETLLTDHYFGQPVWRLQQLLALYIVKLSTVRYMCWWEAIIGPLFANELHQVDNIKLHFHDYYHWRQLDIDRSTCKNSTSFILIYLLMMRIVVNYSLSSSLKVNIAH